MLIKGLNSNLGLNCPVLWRDFFFALFGNIKPACYKIIHRSWITVLSRLYVL